MGTTMKTTRIQNLLSAALFGALPFATASAWAQATPDYINKIPEQIITPDTLEAGIGTLKFFGG